MPKPGMQAPRVFAYIITTVDTRYRLTGYVPFVQDGRVFFGPCKKKMRPDIRKGDYIMGISGSSAQGPRRVILWMKVGERPMRFAEAWERGKSNATFRKLRGKAIHIRPLKDTEMLSSPDCYEHIPGAQHEDDWKSDVRGNRDVFLVGALGSWVAERDAPEVTRELVEALRGAIHWRGFATIHNPLTQNARGRHVILTGADAQEVISSMPKRTAVSTRGSKTGCQHECRCK